MGRVGKKFTGTGQVRVRSYGYGYEQVYPYFLQRLWRHVCRRQVAGQPAPTHGQHRSCQPTQTSLDVHMRGKGRSQRVFQLVQETTHLAFQALHGQMTAASNSIEACRQRSPHDWLLLTTSCHKPVAAVWRRCLGSYFTITSCVIRPVQRHLLLLLGQVTSDGHF